VNRFRIQSLAFAVSFAFIAGAPAQGMSKPDYKAARDGIAADHKAAEAACKPLTGNARDICKAEAKGKEKVARAELDERNNPGSTNRYEVRSAKAKAAYAIAREKCDDLSAADNKACVAEAKAAEARALADAKAEMKTAEAAKPATTGAATTVAASAPAAKKETPGEYVDDTVITAKVKAAVLEEPSLKSAEINVETYKGIVQLSGFVRSRADINKAVEVAGTVKGVASIKNVMIVKGQQ